MTAPYTPGYTSCVALRTLANGGKPLIDTPTLIDEQLLSLPQAARRLPPGRRGRPVTLSCILRWILDGVPGPDGQRVRLEAVRLGGRWLTSVEALARYAARLTPHTRDTEISTHRTPRQRQQASERAARKLEEIHI
jgi:hypothetical protein